jgi:hypothetical protein
LIAQSFKGFLEETCFKRKLFPQLLNIRKVPLDGELRVPAECERSDRSNVNAWIGAT